MDGQNGAQTSSMDFYTYRTRAIKWRSRLGADPLRIHARSDFLCHFYVII